MSNARWSEHSEGKLIVTYTNICNERIYFTYRIPSETSSDAGGADGLRGGQSKNKYSYNATGQYGYSAVGSIKESKDWVCNSKYSG